MAAALQVRNLFYQPRTGRQWRMYDDTTTPWPLYWIEETISSRWGICLISWISLGGRLQRDSIFESVVVIQDWDEKGGRRNDLCRVVGPARSLKLNGVLFFLLYDNDRRSERSEQSCSIFYLEMRRRRPGQRSRSYQNARLGGVVAASF